MNVIIWSDTVVQAHRPKGFVGLIARSFLELDYQRLSQIVLCVLFRENTV